ncbi:hypothetical protein DFR49_0248 [Hephaestia caeni]|uniref:Uncharacterized protein n=1 Tax=Hephaestia caeni TaxID=645617 RepID=A0A397PBE6_9SPHN|nr:hypothetical protein [Hephaestia caeni]RIA45723.1 hypothetical protein DFR49_0248 [Hephaestia caeni]
MMWWSAACAIAAIYCVVRGIVDLRRKHYSWGVVGLASGAVLLLTPVQTHAVKIDLPIANPH